MLSVIVPVYNEEKYITQCVDSILEQDYPKEDLEILLVDGMSTDRTREILKPYLKKYTFIRLLDNRRRVVPSAMNIGIKEAKGDVIIRLDAHSYYPSNYFSILTKRLEELGADNVGVPCRTDVMNSTPKTLAIKEVLSNSLGVGNSTFRTGTTEVMKVDTVPFGCWRREVFEKYGLFDERLRRNQDIEHNKRILRKGGKIYLLPDTYCVYWARETYRGLSRNNYANGKWNIKTVNFTRQFSSLSMRHFIPMFFVLSLIVPVLLGIFFPPLAMLSSFSLGAYVLVMGLESICLAIRKGLNPWWLFSTFVVLHVSYGWGSIMGLLETKFLTKK